LGNAPAHKLFDLIQVARQDSGTPARSIGDYAISTPPVGRLDAYPGVELLSLCN
jgi:CRISPR-associated protein Csd2